MKGVTQIFRNTEAGLLRWRRSPNFKKELGMGLFVCLLAGALGISIWQLYSHGEDKAHAIQQRLSHVNRVYALLAPNLERAEKVSENYRQTWADVQKQVSAATNLPSLLYSALQRENDLDIIGFATLAGEYRAADRNVTNNSIRLVAAGPSLGGQVRFFERNHLGNFQHSLTTNLAFMALNRPWFRTNEPGWSDIYHCQLEARYFISYSVAVQTQQRLAGVFTVGINLSKINRHLREAAGRNEAIYILEPNGNLVASSTDPSAFQPPPSGRRLRVQESQNPMIAWSGAFLATNGVLNVIGTNTVQLKCSLAQEDYIVQLRALPREKTGWIIVSVLRQQDVDNLITANNPWAILLSTLGLATVLALSLFALRLIGSHRDVRDQLSLLHGLANDILKQHFQGDRALVETLERVCRLAGCVASVAISNRDPHEKPRWHIPGAKGSLAWAAASDPKDAMDKALADDWLQRQVAEGAQTRQPKAILGQSLRTFPFGARIKDVFIVPVMMSGKPFWTLVFFSSVGRSRRLITPEVMSCVSSELGQVFDHERATTEIQNQNERLLIAAKHAQAGENAKADLLNLFSHDFKNNLGKFNELFKFLDLQPLSRTARVRLAMHHEMDPDFRTTG